MAEILDIMIYESGTGGDLNIKNDDLESIQGLTNQVYIALFGGNIEQNTSINLQDVEQRFDYWGNAYLTNEEQFNSNFERTLQKVALTSAGISVLEDAAKKDLEYLKAYADIEILGSIISVGKFQLDVILKQPNVQSTKITFIWDGTRNEVIETIVL